jgi:hypothetical protein
MPQAPEGSIGQLYDSHKLRARPNIRPKHEQRDLSTILVTHTATSLEAG